MEGIKYSIQVVDGNYLIQLLDGGVIRDVADLEPELARLLNIDLRNLNVAEYPSTRLTGTVAVEVDGIYECVWFNGKIFEIIKIDWMEYVYEWTYGTTDENYQCVSCDENVKFFMQDECKITVIYITGNCYFFGQDTDNC